MKLQEGRFIQGLRNMFSLRWDMADPDEIHNTIISGAKLQGTNMCILMLAILIASIGLNMNSTAVIIGAMLISPLNAARWLGAGIVVPIHYDLYTEGSVDPFEFKSKLESTTNIQCMVMRP